MAMSRPVPLEYKEARSLGLLSDFLTDRELQVLSLLYGDSDIQIRTERAVAKILGVSASRPGQIKARALSALRYFMNTAYDHEDHEAIEQLGIDESMVGKDINISSSRRGVQMAQIIDMNLERRVITIRTHQTTKKVRPRYLLRRKLARQPRGT